MKRSDISDNFYTKDRSSSKGKKKSYVKENDCLARKKKIAFKNYVKNLHEDEDEENSFYYNDLED
jgi:ribosomal 30S subunit maturation factor RimM